MKFESPESKIQASITLFIILTLVMSAIYGMVIDSNFELLDKFVEITRVPMGVVVAYYFGTRFYQNEPKN